MHYVEQGSGPPIVLLHGNPMSNYLWRNIIPHVSKVGRAIAPDLIGMGKSDKPPIKYTYDDHFRYIEGFIEALDLESVVLVLHDWGSGIGFRYAHVHSRNVRGIVFFEAMVQSLQTSDLPPNERFAITMLRSPVGWFMGQVANIMIKKLIPDMIIRKLTQEEKAFYAAPFPTIASRKPLAQFPKEIPFGGKPASNKRVIDAYSAWLQESEAEVPKLFLKFTPGVAINAKKAAWVEANFKYNLTVRDMGPGRHFVQEDCPDEIGQAIVEWYTASGLR